MKCLKIQAASMLVFLTLVPSTSASVLSRRGKPPLHAFRTLRWTQPSKSERERSLQQQGSLDIPLEGDPSCPCVPLDGLPSVSFNDLDEKTQIALGNQIDFSTFGYGCQKHDQGLTNSCRECTDPKRCPWCDQSWCYIDADKCSLHKARGIALRFYSYATCRGIDSYTSSIELRALKGKTFRVGINHHPGGWSGAYHAEKKQYEGPIEKWSGPIVDFFRVAADKGGFSMNLTTPPAFLKNRTKLGNFFDECIYATTLGYLDFCIGTYAATNTRILSTDFAVLAQSNYFLVLQGDLPGNVFEEWSSSMGTIFQPFETPVWYFIVFFVIPIMGLLFIVHEYNKTGSLYPKSTFVVVTKKDSPVEEIQERAVPIYRHMIRSIYVSFLSVLQSGYDNPIITEGGRIHLIGFAFFILTLLAVYTANLAAILQFQVYKEKIDSLETAVKEAYSICAIRELVHLTLQAYPKITAKNFVPDPIDGLPGFAISPDRQSRVLNFLDTKKAKEQQENDAPYSERIYCHAALSFEQDLQLEWANGRHCDKIIVGDAVGALQVGVPIFEKVSKAMISLLFNLKNDGEILRTLKKSQPNSTCTKVAVSDDSVNEKRGGTGKSLTVPELSGIWFISFGFALFGLILTIFTACHRKRGNTRGRVLSLYRQDQHGERINRLERHDDWVTDEDDVKVSVDHKGRLRSHSSNASGASCASSMHTKRATYEQTYEKKKMEKVLTSKMRAEYTIPASAYRSYPVVEAQFEDSVASSVLSSDSSNKSVKLEDIFAASDDVVRKRKTNPKKDTTPDDAIWEPATRL